MDDAQLKECVSTVRRWVERVVIGEGLCPFAAPVATTIRYIAPPANDLNSLLQCLEAELGLLMNTDPLRLPTIVIATPCMLEDFDDYLDALELVESAIEDAGLAGTIQVASFHPDYRFDGVESDDPSNYTNRSPWPIFHLLREEQIEAAIEGHPDIASVPKRNIEHFRKLGVEGIRRLMEADAEEK